MKTVKKSKFCKENETLFLSLVIFLKAKYNV